jgi:hypothetical protein
MYGCNGVTGASSTMITRQYLQLLNRFAVLSVYRFNSILNTITPLKYLTLTLLHYSANNYKFDAIRKWREEIL